MGNEIAVEALRQALSLERQGLRFYRQAAQRVPNAAAQQMFLNLASDEGDHHRMLSAQLRSLKAGKGWRSFPQTAAAKPVEPRESLFPKGKAALGRAIPTASTEAEALRFGLDIENRSFVFYSKAAQQAETAEGQAMYNFLAEVERSHFNLLMMRYEGLAGPAAWAS